MARPQVVEYLKHGKALCGKVFRHFVETFNFVVRATVNLKGDADLPGATKGIKVDKTDPENPIIRLVGNFGSGNDSGGGGVSVGATGMFGLSGLGTDTVTVINRYYMLSTSIRLASDEFSIKVGNCPCVIGLIFNGGTTGDPVSFVREQDLYHLLFNHEHVYPLYELISEEDPESGDPVILMRHDFRSIPVFPVWEE